MQPLKQLTIHSSTLSTLSVAVVFYNNDAELVNQLVLNIFFATSAFKDVELFLINNSSMNLNLTSLLQEKEKSDRRIKVIIPDRNLGFGSGNNLVLPFINSDYHLIINPDVSISDDSQIPTMIEFLNQNPEIGLLSPLIKFPNGDVQRLLKKESNIFDMLLRFVGVNFFKKRQEKFISLPDGYNHVHYAENVPGSFMVFRSSVFKAIGGFDEKYFLYMEDSDITKKVNQVSKTVFFPNAFVYHAWQRQNRKSFRGIVIMLRSMVTYFNKWGWKLF
ncbi:glycosyltransferase [Oenococcus oeni]|nr:glycosyltransferase [Oenococcus oeni]OIM08186.1 glycosyl transferase [Oenococcus oeni]